MIPFLSNFKFAKRFFSRFLNAVEAESVLLRKELRSFLCFAILLEIDFNSAAKARTFPLLREVRLIKRFEGCLLRQARVLAPAIAKV